MSHKSHLTTVYHYTDEEGRRGIEASKEIWPSLYQGKDAVFGEGVYVNRMNPEAGRTAVAENNYGAGLGQAMKEAGRVDHVIEMQISRSQVSKAHTARDVGVVKGREPLRLEGGKVKAWRAYTVKPTTNYK